MEYQCLSEELYLVLSKLNHAKTRSIRKDVFKAQLLHNGNYFEELAVCSWGVSKLSLQALVTLGSSKYSISLEAYLTHSIDINITCLALTAFTTCFINIFCFLLHCLSSPFFCCKYFWLSFLFLTVWWLLLRDRRCSLVLFSESFRYLKHSTH